MSERSKFFKKLKKEHYLILVPDMLPYHFNLIASVFSKHGYKTQVVTIHGREVKDEGLKSVHNDSCYPALLVTGQFICELKSGKYDLNHTCVMMSQTGGGCRASNYISLIRKAINKEFPTVPVLSLNFSGLEKERSIPMTLPIILEGMMSVFYGDMMMLLYNQVKPYETYDGEAKEIQQKVFNHVVNQLNNKEKGFYKMQKNYKYMINEFSKIKIPEKRKPRVGIVGEIYVKYSSLANNNLVDFLVNEGCEVVQPSLLEFLLYCLANNETDYKLYHKNVMSHKFVKLAYKWCYKKSIKMREVLKGTQFKPYDDFETIKKNSHKIISRGVKMGEGWLIPSEMVTMEEEGIIDIVCAQPFGCLPNHIVGKGMIRPVKALCPELNICAIDYDPGATQVNQENRIKLMLSNIKNK